MSDNIITALDNVPVSFLQPCSIDELSSSESLFLISVPNKDTETGFISKKIKFEDIEDLLCSDFQIYKIQHDISSISSQFSQLDLSEKSFVCNTIPNPYIISSITEASCSITSISGYRLSAGMQQYFISGTKFTGKLRIDSLELYGEPGNPRKGFIDFHYNGDTTVDYTGRIIEEQRGTIAIISNLHVPGNLAVDGDTTICGDITVCGDVKIDWDEHIKNVDISSHPASSYINIAPSYNATYRYGQQILRAANNYTNSQRYTLPYASSSVLGGVYLWSGTLDQYNALASNNQINSHALYFVHG